MTRGVWRNASGGGRTLVPNASTNFTTTGEAAYFEAARGYLPNVIRAMSETYEAALTVPSNAAKGHGQFLRLTSEFVIAIETVVSWVMAFENRGDAADRGLLFQIVNYRPSAPGDFLEAVRRDGWEVGKLRLPDADDMVALWAAWAEDIEAGATLPPSAREDFEGSLDQLARNIQRHADLWVDDDLALRTIYNKGKHGMPILPMPEEGSDRPDLGVIRKDGLAVPVVVNSSNIKAMQHGISACATDLDTLVCVASVLSHHDRLYGPVARSGATSVG